MFDFGKMGALKAQMDEIKSKLETMTVTESIQNNAVSITINGNKRITSININEEILEDKDIAEDLILLAVNKAMEKAEKLNEQEMQGAASSLLGGLNL